jgi:hypothetical protein
VLTQIYIDGCPVIASGDIAEALAINDYVVHGEGDPAEALAGIYFWTWQTEEVLAMVDLRMNRLGVFSEGLIRPSAISALDDQTELFDMQPTLFSTRSWRWGSFPRWL